RRQRFRDPGARSDGAAREPGPCRGDHARGGTEGRRHGQSRAAADLRPAQPHPRAQLPAHGARGPGQAGGGGLRAQPMAATAATASAEQAQSAQDALELVLARVRVRARRRAAWLAHLGEASAGQPDAFGPALSAAFDGRDTPDAEAAWYANAAAAQPLNQELEQIQRTLAGDAGARLRELQRMFRLSEPELDLLQTCLALALDPGLGRAFGHLQQDPSRGYVTEPLAARLFGHGRRLLCEAGGPLLGWGLVTAGDASPCQPLPFSVDPIVIAWLSGELRMDPQLMGISQVVEPREPLPTWPVAATAQAMHRVIERGAAARAVLRGP